jgi:hypothetical protein
MTNSRDDRRDGVQSPVDYAPSAAPRPRDSSDVSAAQTDTATSETEPVSQSNPGPTVGDTTGEDPRGADDTR